MRKLFTMVCMLMCIPLFNVFSISLLEIQENPQKFVNVFEAPQATYYVDVDSVKLLRESSPYYTMQVDLYCAVYGLNSIGKSVYTFNYNYERSYQALRDKEKRNFPNLLNQQIALLIADEVTKDSGVVWSFSNKILYSFDGEFLGEYDVNLSRKASFGDGLYRCANFIFFRYFGQAFYIL